MIDITMSNITFHSLFQTSFIICLVTYLHVMYLSNLVTDFQHF